MKGKLYKAPNREYYWLRVDEQIFAATAGPPLRSIDYWLDISDDTITKRQLIDLGMLSIKNCEEIANGYDLDELANENYPLELWAEGESLIRKLAFTKGFQKAIEILGDKKFSEGDMKEAMLNALEMTAYQIEQFRKDNKYHIATDIIQSLQQTEWDVEIEMERSKFITDKSLRNDIKNGWNYTQKLDADGCLILKRI